MLKWLRRMISLTLITVFFLVGCTSESPSIGQIGQTLANHPPSIRSATIVPNPVILTKTVSTQIQAEDLDGNLITFRYQWHVNGRPIPKQTNSLLIPHMLKRDDLLTVDLIPFDGNIEGPPYRTAAVAVGNTPPEVTRVELEPLQIRVGDRLEVQVDGIDADQDPVQYKFRWWRNNSEVVDEEENQLETAKFTRGDTVIVEVTPYDGHDKGKSRLAGPVVILNSPPNITSVPPGAIHQDRYEYTVTAVDPDGDLLSYALDTAPKSMKIDSTTGRIEWKIPPKTIGTHHVRVTVQDGQEGQAFQEFDLILTELSGS